MSRMLGWTLRLFPSTFRDRYAEELAEVLYERARDLRQRAGRLAVAKMWAFQLSDLLRSAMAERRTERLRRQRRLWSAADSGRQPSPPSRMAPSRDPRHGFDRGSRHRAPFSSVLWWDIRYAFRAFRRSPVFSMIVVLTMAIGIGGTAAVFGVINGVLLEPLPYEDPHELVSIFHTAEGLGPARVPLSEAMYLTYRDHGRVFESVGIWNPVQVAVTGAAEPERVDAMWISEEIFTVLGVQPAMGRTFTTREIPEDSLQVILAHGYWQRRLGGDPEIIGKTLYLEAIPWTVVGVMPDGFRFLDHEPSVYLPAYVSPNGGIRSFDYNGMARLHAEATLKQANADVARMIPLTAEQFGWATQAELEEWRLGPDVEPLATTVVGDIGIVLWVLLGTFVAVLLIVCANVANLFLVQAESRQREVALRTALGASKARIARQLLTESVIVGLAGGIAGLWVGYAGLRLLVYMAPANLPRLHSIGMDPLVVIAALVASFLAGITFGLVPLFATGDRSLPSSLKEMGAGSGTGKPRHRVRTSLAVAQVALATSLLIGAGLMIRSFVALNAVDPGFGHPEEVLSVRLPIPRAEVRNFIDAVPITEEVLKGLSEIPGVISVGAVSALSVDQAGNTNVLHVAEAPLAAGIDPPACYYKAIAGDYFEAMEIPLLAGRTIGWDDIHARRPVGLISENIALEYWGSPSEAVGKRIRHHPEDPWREVIGVVGDVRDLGIGHEPPMVAYWPMAVENFLGFDLWVRRDMAYVIRSARPAPLAMMPEVREAIRRVKPSLPVANVQTLDAVVARSMARTSFTLVMLGIAATAAVVLGTVGIYGVISYVFAQRTREMGVRIAMGATFRDVRWLVLRRAAAVACAGVMIGIAAAIGLTQFISTLLYGVHAADLATFAGAASAVLIVSLLASYLPARRAARVNPVESLRGD
jgi:predicted permease